jgi:hypothetical protein
MGCGISSALVSTYILEEDIAALNSVGIPHADIKLLLEVSILSDPLIHIILRHSLVFVLSGIQENRCAFEAARDY